MREKLVKSKRQPSISTDIHVQHICQPWIMNSSKYGKLCAKHDQFNVWLDQLGLPLNNHWNPNANSFSFSFILFDMKINKARKWAAEPKRRRKKKTAAKYTFYTLIMSKQMAYLLCHELHRTTNVLPIVCLNLWPIRFVAFAKREKKKKAPAMWIKLKCKCRCRLPTSRWSNSFAMLEIQSIHKSIEFCCFRIV